MEEYDAVLVRKPIRSSGKVVSGSHYNDPDRKYGNSRDAGDASPEVQRQVIHAIVAAGKKGGPRVTGSNILPSRGSVERLANAVHYAGYPDDPLYRMRIMAAAQDPLMKWALRQYDR